MSLLVPVGLEDSLTLFLANSSLLTRKLELELGSLDITLYCILCLYQKKNVGMKKVLFASNEMVHHAFVFVYIVHVLVCHTLSKCM